MNNIEQPGISAVNWFYIILQNMLIGFKLADIGNLNWWQVFAPTIGLVGITVLGILVVTFIGTINTPEE